MKKILLDIISRKITSKGVTTKENASDPSTIIGTITGLLAIWFPQGVAGIPEDYQLPVTIVVLIFSAYLIVTERK